MALFKIEDKTPRTIELGGVVFNTFSKDDRGMFENICYSLGYEYLVWESNFPYLLSFANTSDVTKTKSRVIWKTINEHVCVFEYYEKAKRLYLYGTPIKKDGTVEDLKEALPSIVKVMEKVNGDHFSAMDFIPNKIVCECLDVNGLNKSNICNSDFIFKARELIELSGRKFKSRRNAISKFKNRYPNHVFREYNDNDYLGLMNLRNKWLEDKFNGDVKKAWDYHIFIDMIDNYKDTGLKIFVCEIDGIIEGFITICKLGNDCSCVVSENTNKEISGLAEFCWYEGLRATEDLGEFSNDGNGGGVGDSLYKYKLSHNPVLILEKRLCIMNKSKEKIDYSIFNGGKDEGII